MENLRKRVSIDIVTSEEKAEKLVSAPSFVKFKIISRDVAVVQRLKKKLFLNRPLYSGFTILDLAKLFLYKFHYGFVREKFGSKAELLFTDTDSLCYQFHDVDVYRLMKDHDEYFDTSNFSTTHPIYSIKNKKVLGKMKDEMGGALISEFIGLRPKLYSLLTDEGEEKCVGKGITRSTLKRKIRHNTYKECLLRERRTHEDMTSIQSFNHQLHTVKRRKVALSPADDKRYICRDGIHTYAYGHIMCGLENVSELWE